MPSAVLNEHHISIANNDSEPVLNRLERCAKNKTKNFPVVLKRYHEHLQKFYLVIFYLYHAKGILPGGKR